MRSVWQPMRIGVILMTIAAGLGFHPSGSELAFSDSVGRFDEHDGDGDGVIAGDEAPVDEEVDYTSKFRSSDRNRDGIVTRYEWYGLPDPEDAFNEGDESGDFDSAPKQYSWEKSLPKANAADIMGAPADPKRYSWENPASADSQYGSEDRVGERPYSYGDSSYQ